MSSSQQHHHTTSMFARVVGPYLVIIAITAALRPADMKTLLSQFEANSLWAWVVGAFILLLGSRPSPFTPTGGAQRRSLCRSWAGLWRSKG